MKNIILNLTENKSPALEVDSAISFSPFIKYLKEKIKEEKTVKAAIYRNALKEIKKLEVGNENIPLDEIHKYERLLEHIYACLSPTSATEDELAWGLCYPLQPITFYGTSLMYHLMENKENDQQSYIVSKTPEEYINERLHLAYTFIFKELYNFQPPLKTHQFHAGMKTDTGVQGYFHVNINTDFIEVRAKRELPKFSVRELQQFLNEESGMNKLLELLPLDLFEFRGFSVITIRDVTALHAVENIKKIRVTHHPGAETSSYEEVIQSLKALVQNNNIEFDLFPFVRINGRMVYGYVKGGSGILFSVWGESRLSPEMFRKYAEGYASNPESFYSPDLSAESKEMFPWLQSFIELDVKSMALLPIFYDHVLVGVLGMHTWVGETFDEKALSLLEPAIGPIAQLLQVYIDEFNMEIENIIKEKYTSIQPSVQWKFNEAAWHQLLDKKKNRTVINENIIFNDVYPFYGAIDIRNSTTERNIANKADLGLHLSMLHETLVTLKRDEQSSLLEEMLFNCEKWIEKLKEEELNAAEENNLNTFLLLETTDYLKDIIHVQPGIKKVVDKYLELVLTNEGEVYKNRQALEVSMQMINMGINDYFELEKEKLQKVYPCYFEKFRTDGVEYDIYIGQSIEPNRPFNSFHLKNLRLWQLASMAHIAKMVNTFLPDMPVKLRTTQLILIHNHTIDISFRTDERKFDVEGAYNIRYQMIKKRIDKVLIRGTEERLTQPDKLALIYLNEKDIADYRPLVKYLQETGVFHNEMEELILEDLQGLSGLKALRIGIV